MPKGYFPLALWNYTPVLRSMPVPGIESVLEEPTICVRFSQKLVPYLLGLLEIYRWRDKLHGTDAEIQTALGVFQDLLVILTEGNCTMAITAIRVNGCALEVQYDGVEEWFTVGDLTACAVPGPKGDPGEPGAAGADGAPGADGQDGASAELRKTETHIQWRQDDDDPTWGNLLALADIKGDTGAPGPKGDTGETGPAGPQGPKGDKGDPGDSEVDPGDPPGEPSNGQRCGVAIGLTDWIQAIHEDQMTQIGASIDIAQAVLATAGAFTGLLLPGLALAMEIIQQVGLSVIAMENNTDFWEAVRCKLYCLLPTSGAVDAGIISAWAAALVPLNDVGYLPVKALIENGVSLGEFRRRAYAYSLVPYDLCEALCTECLDEWCYEWDFTQVSGAWGAVAPYGEWVSGVGWRYVANQGLIIGISFATSQLTHVEMTYTIGNTTSPNGSGIGLYFNHNQVALQSTDTSGNGTFTPTWNGDVQADQLVLNPFGGSTATPIITRCLVRGTGANPFGEDNCP